MLKLFLIAQAFHAASGQEVGGESIIPPDEGAIASLREAPTQVTALAPKAEKHPRTLPKFLQWFLVAIQPSTVVTAILAGILALPEAKSKALLWVALALCVSANISIFIVFLFSVFKGWKSNRFPLFITTVMGKLFTICLSFILNTVGIVLGIAFLALNAGMGAGPWPLVYIINSFVVYILNLAYFCIYHMPSLGFFSIIWTPKLGFAATTGDPTPMGLILAIGTQTAGHFGLSLGSKPFLDAVLLVVQIIGASGGNFRNWFINILQWFLAQRQKQEDARVNGPGGNVRRDGAEGGPTGNPMNVVVGA